MRRDLVLVGGALLLLVAAVGGMVLFADSDAPDDNVDTDDDPGDFDPTTETPQPTNETNNSTEAPPVFAVDDPGRNSYPRNPSSPHEEIVGSKQLSDHLFDQINYRRSQDDLPDLYTSATLASMTRTHSWDMYNRSYFDTTSPDGLTPVDRYNGTATNCTTVTEYIFHETRVVETADGDRRHVSSEGIAANVFSEMLDDETMTQTMLSDEYDGVGTGAYVVGEENDAGETVVNVHVTVDYCIEG